MLVNEKKISSLKKSSETTLFKNKIETKSTSPELKILVNDVEKQGNNNKPAGSQEVESKNNPLNSVKESDIKNVNDIKISNIRKISGDEKPANSVQAKNVSPINEKDLVSETEKLNQNNNVPKPIEQEKNKIETSIPKIVTDKIVNDKKNITESINVTQNKEAINEKETTGKEVQKSDAVKPAIKLDSENKFGSRVLEEVQSKTGPKSIDTKSEHKNVNKTEPAGSEKITTNSEESIKAAEQADVRQPIHNKKVSVRVKGEIKSINEKSEINSNFVKGYSTSENLAESMQNNSENNNSNFTKTPTFTNNPLEEKVHNEKIFQQVLNKEEITAQKAATEKSAEPNLQAGQRLVKSIEVVREVSKFIARQERGSLSINVTPEHLGKLKITLDTIDNTLKARIEVDNEQSRQLIERNLDKLEQELTKNGVELNSLNISLGYSNDQKEENEITKKTNKPSDNPDQVGETEEEVENKKSLGYNTYEYIA